jgi:SNF2 family DNA or RNA helicase
MMEKQFAYPFPASTFKVQRITTELFTQNKRAYCLNELGTGKTRSALFAYDWLRRLLIVEKMLVICPLSALERTWGQEISNHLPWLRYAILHGTKAQRISRLSQPVNIFIINHDGVEVIMNELMEMQNINCVTVDELASYRNGGSRRTKHLKVMVRGKHYVWGMTGSPIPRAVTDVWGPCSCITPYTVPSSFHAFRAQLMYKQGPFKWIAKQYSEERAVSCMQPATRFSLNDVTELPEKVTNYYEAILTPHQRYTYESMRKTAIALVGDKKIDALNAGAVLSKLLQIALGYAYTRKGEVVTFDNTPRLQLILDLIDSAVKKVILFAPFKSAVAALSKMLESNKLDHCIITGEVGISKRNIIFRDFQDTKKYKVLLAHPACMSHSLTLTAASTTIWAGPTTSLEIFQQANARTYRVGQDSKTLIAMIGGTHAEEKIYRLLGNNETIQNRFLEILEIQTEKLMEQEKERDDD